MTDTRFDNEIIIVPGSRTDGDLATVLLGNGRVIAIGSDHGTLVDLIERANSILYLGEPRAA